MQLGSFLSGVTFNKLSYLSLLLNWSCWWSVNNLPYAITRCQTLYRWLRGCRDFNITLKPRFQSWVFTKISKAMSWKEAQWIWWMEKTQTEQNVFHITCFWSPISTILWKYHVSFTIWLPLYSRTSRKSLHRNLAKYSEQRRVLYLVMSFFFNGWKFAFIHPIILENLSLFLKFN